MGHSASTPLGASEPSGHRGMSPSHPFGVSLVVGSDGHDAGTIARPCAEESVNCTSADANGLCVFDCKKKARNAIAPTAIILKANCFLALLTRGLDECRCVVIVST